MAEILIVYYSKTGHAEKMALAIAEGAKQVKGVDAELKKVEQRTLKTCKRLKE
jgi:NAD(P)H dehydrogenase (quinone)